MANSSWLKLWRNVLQNPIIMKDSEYFMLWHILLCMAEYEPTTAMLGGKPIMLKPGQLTTGRKQLSVNSGISESKVERILNAFETAHQIEQQKTNKNRLITIVNWEKYQGSGQQIRQQTNIHRTSTEQQVNTLEEYKNIRNKEIDGGFASPPEGGELPAEGNGDDSIEVDGVLYRFPSRWRRDAEAMGKDLKLFVKGMYQ